MDNRIIKQTAYELFGIGAGPEDAKSGKRAAQPAPQPAKPVQSAPVAAPAPVKPAASYLAPGTVLEGQLRSEGDLELAGSFKGSITTNGSVITGTMSVARGAAICGSVEMGKKPAKKQQDAQQA